MDKDREIEIKTCYINDFKKMVGDQAKWQWLIDYARNIGSDFFHILLHDNGKMSVKFEIGIDDQKFEYQYIYFDNSLPFTDATKAIINALRIHVEPSRGVK